MRIDLGIHLLLADAKTKVQKRTNELKEQKLDPKNLNSEVHQTPGLKLSSTAPPLAHIPMRSLVRLLVKPKDFASSLIPSYLSR